MYFNLLQTTSETRLLGRLLKQVQSQTRILSMSLLHSTLLLKKKKKSFFLPLRSFDRKQMISFTETCKEIQWGQHSRLPSGRNMTSSSPPEETHASAEIPTGTCAPSSLGKIPQTKEPQLLCDTTCQNRDKVFDIIQPPTGGTLYTTMSRSFK